MSYQDRLMDLSKLVALSGKLGGAVLDAHVFHDDGCPALRGSGCRCEPEVALVGRDGDGVAVRLRMRSDGTVEADA